MTTTMPKTALSGLRLLATTFLFALAAMFGLMFAGGSASPEAPLNLGSPTLTGAPCQGGVGDCVERNRVPQYTQNGVPCQPGVGGCGDPSPHTINGVPCQPGVGGCGYRR